MPVGTVMIKTFMFDGKRVETRLLAHPDAATWNGYSYQWNEAQTEAMVIPDDRLEATFDTGQHMVDWHFPNRVDCNGCHTASAGGTLGPETRQMNRVVDGMSQIDRWKALGLFEGAGPSAPYQAALMLPYDGQLGAVPAGATTEQRARSYLHANCAYCHRPDGEFTFLDFRYDTALEDMGACGAAPMNSDVGVTGALVLTPAMPMKSVLWLRMSSPKIDEKTRMPQLATYVVDATAVALVGEWITSITSCP
jgi:mono/diheme cytochrome c family protein